MELASTPVRPKPYNAGMWVRGEQFYGRKRLIADILDGSDRAIWVVGNRRIGKTSLLYRIQEVANQSGRIAFYIPIDGAETSDRLAECFLEDLDDDDPRLERLGLKLADLGDKTPAELIRTFDRAARDRGSEVVLLIDETEALISIACESDEILKDLHRRIRHCLATRVVIAATKRLLKLDEICNQQQWVTERFLDPFALYFLGSLERDEALALLRQSQSANPQPLDDSVAQAILDATACHPYLTQSLAFALWSDGVVRAPAHGDLAPTPGSQWSRMFQEDYECLSDNERRIIHGLTEAESLNESAIAALIGRGAQPEQVHSLLSTLAQLCYVRADDANYCIGNELLRNWLRSGQAHEPETVVSNEIAEDMASEEQQAITAQIDTWERRLWALEEQQAQRGIDTPPEITNEIADITQKIGELKTRLSKLRARQA